MKKIILFIALFGLLTDCNYKQSEKTHESGNHSVLNTPIVKIDCDSAWRKLIFTSNYSPLGEEFDNDSLNIRILNEDITDSVISIKIISIIGDSELPLGWVKVDLNRKTLSDITNEDSVINLTVNNSLLDVVLKNCVTTNR